MTDKILFLTGKLAEKRLTAILESMEPVDFEYEIRNIGVSVAALMTAQMIGRRLKEVEGFNRIIVPGLCRGDINKLSEELGLEIIRGPVDLKDLPQFFGRDCQAPDLSRYDVTIFGEIVEAPMVDIPAILKRAKQFRADGADVIDIGCLPDTEFPHMEDTIKALKKEGFMVSIDSLEEDDLLRGGKAGADFLLSLKESSLWILDEVESTPILIPETHGDMTSMYRVIEQCMEKGRDFLADPILDPIHFGFTESIVRYRDLREKYPDVPVMMGIGNITELTEADTTGINAILFGIISELKLDAVLATQVSGHCRTAIREGDKARRMMFTAREQESLPKGLDGSLLSTHARKPFPYPIEEIQELAADVKDPNYRVQTSAEGIHVYNRDGLHTADNPYDLFPHLKELEDDPPHAFYMGVEIAKAQIAFQLGKHYRQDEELDWGAASYKRSEDELDKQSRAAHALKDINNEKFEEEKSTVKASRDRKKQRNKKKTA